jgi:hypothetical protein
MHQGSIHHACFHLLMQRSRLTHLGTDSQVGHFLTQITQPIQQQRIPQTYFATDSDQVYFALGQRQIS